MDKRWQEGIIEALKSKGAIQPCPRCANVEFEILGETKIPLAPEPGTLAEVFGAPRQVPVIVVSCSRCGYIAYHAKGLLGLKE